ncbi:MAG: hypothetical protein FJ161_04385, partial [Gammaproteobacteria bacterium]|nr:hypothetical protein [Gammaproteobacteria bacterium]
MAPELNDLDNNSSNLNNNQSNIALFKNDIALGKGLIHKVLYHGLVVLLKIHNHHQAQALQHANTALIYGGISVREDHRLLQRDLRREGWAEFKKQIINLNPEHNNNSKITKTMLDVFI